MYLVDLYRQLAGLWIKTTISVLVIVVLASIWVQILLKIS